MAAPNGSHATFRADFGSLKRRRNHQVRIVFRMWYVMLAGCTRWVAGELKEDEAVQSNSLSRDLSTCLNDGAHSDFVVQCRGGARFPCHRFVLATRCPAFKAMLQPQSRECQEGVLALTEGPGEVADFLSYLYGNFSVSSLKCSNLCRLAILAQKYIAEELRRSCMEEVSRRCRKPWKNLNVFAGGGLDAEDVAAVLVFLEYLDQRTDPVWHEVMLAFCQHADKVLPVWPDPKTLDLGLDYKNEMLKMLACRLAAEKSVTFVPLPGLFESLVGHL